MKITMTAAEAIARVKASCAPWWPESFAEFNAQREGRFRCAALDEAVGYAWHADYNPSLNVGEWAAFCAQRAERCAKTCRVCKKHERIASAVKP